VKSSRMTALFFGSIMLFFCLLSVSGWIIIGSTKEKTETLVAPDEIIENVLPAVEGQNYVIYYTDDKGVVRRYWASRYGDSPAIAITDCPADRKPYAEKFVATKAPHQMIIHIHDLQELHIGGGF
jgi:hypothetical protein